jgi:UDP-N-acetyl-D-mannosaminuronic acid dehydrogenase
VKEKKMPTVMRLAGKDLQTPEKRTQYTICVVGGGKTGIATACLLVEAGFNVIAVDSSSHTIHQLKKGKSPYTETAIRKFIEKHAKNTRFKATTNVRKAVSNSDVIIVGSKASLDKKLKPDYTRLEKACREVGMSLNKGSLIIVQTTTGPGVTETTIKEALENASGLEAGVSFGLAYSSPLNNIGQSSKTRANGTKVVGGLTKRSLKVAAYILETVTDGEVVRVKDIKTAEAVKLLEEAYKDVNTAFTNEFARFCEKAQIDFVKVRNTVDLLKFSKMAGLNVPRDSHFLVEEADALDVKLRMLSMSSKINKETQDHAIRLVRDALKACQKPLRRAKIAVFGISSLPNKKKSTNSATKKLVARLKKSSAIVKVYDPYFSQTELTNIGYATETSMSKTVQGTDCLIIAVAHDRFSKLNLKRIQLLMKQPAAIVDMGQVIDPSKAEKAGLVYRGFGRGVWTK